MKRFKEFLMEQDQDFEILNSLNDFLENFDEENYEDIDQEIIAKYLICKSLQLRDFNLKTEKNNNNLKNLENKCRIFFNDEVPGNEELINKFDTIDSYISEKYKRKTINFLLTKSEIKSTLESEYTTLNKFLNKVEEIIEKKLEAAETAENEKDDDSKEQKKDDGKNSNSKEEPIEGEKDDDSKEQEKNESKKIENTRQGSYLGRFTSKQSEDIMSGNKDKIRRALETMAKAAKDRCDELLRQAKEKVEKNSKYLEEEIAQKVLWGGIFNRLPKQDNLKIQKQHGAKSIYKDEDNQKVLREGIFNRLPKQEKLKIQKQHGAKSIYKDKGNQKLSEIINNYKDQIDDIVNTTVRNCQPLGEKLHAFSTSAKMEEKLKEQLRMNVSNFTNKMYDITLEVEKASRKSGFFENRKIEKGAKKEEEWNKFINSEKGEIFNRRLKERAAVLKKELLKILPNIQKASSEAEVNIKLVSKLIKDSRNAKDFFNKASSKKIYENGKKISVLDWLHKKWIPLPLRTAISDKYSKDLTVASWKEIFKDKEFLNSLSGYGEDWEKFKIALDKVKTLEDFKKFTEQYGKDFEAEINVFCKNFVEQARQEQQRQPIE